MGAKASLFSVPPRDFRGLLAQSQNETPCIWGEQKRQKAMESGGTESEGTLKTLQEPFPLIHQMRIKIGISIYEAP